MSQQHPSHTSVQQAAMAKYQGRAPTPADLIDIIWQTQRAQEEARRAQLEAVQKQQQAAAQQAQLQQHQAGGAGGVQTLPAVRQAPGGDSCKLGNCWSNSLPPNCAVPTDVWPCCRVPLDSWDSSCRPSSRRCHLGRCHPQPRPCRSVGVQAALDLHAQAA